MIIPSDRTVAVGPGANDFVTELSVKVMHNARHDVKNWKEVPDIAKDRICAHMLVIHYVPLEFSCWSNTHKKILNISIQIKYTDKPTLEKMTPNIPWFIGRKLKFYFK